MELRVFKPNLWSRIKTFGYAVIGGVFVAFIIYIFQSWVADKIGENLMEGLVVGIPIAAAVIGLLFAIFGNRVRFEARGHSLYCYKGNEMTLQIDDLSQYIGGYSQHTRGGDVEKQVLYLHPVSGVGESQEIDCAALSAGLFFQMFAYLQKCGLQESIPTLNAQPQTLIAQPMQGN